MSATIKAYIRPLERKLDLLAEEIARMQSHIGAIQQRLDEHLAYREQDIGETKPRRGRPPLKRRD
jgi:hypothetical protein